MLSSTFDPFLFPLPLTPSVDLQSDHIILTAHMYQPASAVGRDSFDSTTSTGISSGETTPAPTLPSLPPWTPSPSDGTAIDESDEVRHTAGSEETTTHTESSEESEYDSDSGERCNREPNEDDELDSDNRSIVSSIPYADKEEEPMSPSSNESHGQIFTSNRTKGLFSPACQPEETRNTSQYLEPISRRVTWSAMHPSITVTGKRNNPISVSMHQSLQIDTQPRTPPATPSAIKVKPEPSSCPTSPSTTALESELATLTAQLRTAGATLHTKNTLLGTLSAPLPPLLNRIKSLQTTRKSLLTQRHSFNQRIAANREEIKNSQEKAKKMRAKQVKVMEERDRMQFELDGIVGRRREVKKLVVERMYEKELEQRWEDRGARELARGIGWSAPARSGEGEDGEISSDEDSEMKEGERRDGSGIGEWVRVANALIEGDKSVDFNDLLVFQEALGNVDWKVKLEENVKTEPRAVVADAVEPFTPFPRSEASPAFKAEPTDATGVTPPPLPASPAGVHDASEFGSETDGETSDLPTGEITLEKLQEHFKAMERHKREAARMLRMLRGEQQEKGKKRKCTVDEVEGVLGAEKGRNADGGLAKKRRRSNRIISAGGLQ